MKITIELLKKLDACQEQQELFKDTFPDGAEVTIENLKKAEDVWLSIDWLIDTLRGRPSQSYVDEVGKIWKQYKTDLYKCSPDEASSNLWNRIAELRLEHIISLEYIMKGLS